MRFADWSGAWSVAIGADVSSMSRSKERIKMFFFNLSLAAGEVKPSQMMSKTTKNANLGARLALEIRNFRMI